MTVPPDRERKLGLTRLIRCVVVLVVAGAVPAAGVAQSTQEEATTGFRALQLGYLALDAGDFESALDHYARARELAEGDAQRFNALLGYGSAALELDRLDDARQALEQAHRLAPEEASSTMLLGVVCRRQGDLDLAVTLLAEAAAADPGMPQALIELGIAYGALGKHAAQERVCRDALALEPDSLDARLGLAVALYHQDEFDAAATEFRTVIEQDPENLRAHYGLGLALLYSGDREGAIGEIVFLNPRSPELAADLQRWVYPED